MITIKIKNAQALLEQNRGWLISKVVSVSGKTNAIVEKIIADQIREVFQDKGVEADISIVNHTDDSIKEL